MQLSCKAVAEKQFSTARKGYDVHEVDSFMDELLCELKRVFSEMDADKFELAKYREIEYTLTNTLVTAQKTAQTIVAEAEAKAAAIVDEAKAQADHTKAAADRYARERKAADEEEAENFRTEFEKEQNVLNGKLFALRSFEQKYRGTVLETLKNHQTMFERKFGSEELWDQSPAATEAAKAANQSVELSEIYDNLPNSDAELRALIDELSK